MSSSIGCGVAGRSVRHRTGVHFRQLRPLYCAAARQVSKKISLRDFPWFLKPADLAPSNNPDPHRRVGGWEETETGFVPGEHRNRMELMPILLAALAVGTATPLVAALVCALNR